MLALSCLEHLGLGGIALLAQSIVNRSNFWACLGSPGRNLRFPLYDNVFCFCGLTRLSAAYAKARRIFVEVVADVVIVLVVIVVVLIVVLVVDLLVVTLVVFGVVIPSQRHTKSKRNNNN